MKVSSFNNSHEDCLTECVLGSELFVTTRVSGEKSSLVQRLDKQHNFFSSMTEL